MDKVSQFKYRIQQNKKHMKDISKWKVSVKKNVKMIILIFFFLIDNKSDLENREVLNFEAEDYANKNNLEEIQDSKPIQITEEENSGKP